MGSYCAGGSVTARPWGATHAEEKADEVPPVQVHGCDCLSDSLGGGGRQRRSVDAVSRPRIRRRDNFEPANDLEPDRECPLENSNRWRRLVESGRLGSASFFDGCGSDRPGRRRRHSPRGLSGRRRPTSFRPHAGDLPLGSPLPGFQDRKDPLAANGAHRAPSHSQTQLKHLRHGDSDYRWKARLRLLWHGRCLLL